MRRRAAVAAGLAFALAAGAARADGWTVKMYRETADRPEMSLILLGINQGYLAMNAQLARSGQPMLYCPPPSLPFGEPGLRGVLDDKIAELPERGRDRLLISAVLLRGLVDAYPCRAEDGIAETPAASPAGAPVAGLRS